MCAWQLSDLVSSDGGRLSEFPHTPAAFLGLLGSNSGGDSLRSQVLGGPIQHWRFANFASTVFMQVFAGGELLFSACLQRHLDQVYLPSISYRTTA